jgi:hypothetical protein
MKRLLSLALVLVIAGGAMAQDNVGFYRELPNGNYSNFILLDEISLGTPIEFVATLHDATRFSIGGFEMSVDIPGFVTFGSSDVQFPVGAVNVGEGSSYIVGYSSPVPIQNDIFVMMSISAVVIGTPEPSSVLLGAAVPPSIPGHDGPVYANGANPNDLIACGYIDGTAEAFLFSEVVAVESSTFSGVKALFE